MFFGLDPDTTDDGDPLVVIDDVDKLLVRFLRFLFEDDDSFKDDNNEVVETDPLLSSELFKEFF